MTPEREARLCHEFPDLYGSEYNFSACPDSWFELLYNLSQALTGHARRTGLQPVVTDVKEKHGSLRFYADGTDAEADRLIDEAESASEGIPDDGQ